MPFSVRAEGGTVRQSSSLRAGLVWQTCAYIGPDATLSAAAMAQLSNEVSPGVSCTQRFIFVCLWQGLFALGSLQGFRYVSEAQRGSLVVLLLLAATNAQHGFDLPLIFII